MPKITIAGGESSFFCGEGDTILRAGLRSGLGLPHKCNVGACSECRFELLDGLLQPYARHYPALSDRDVERGRGIACQARPATDCTISMQFDAAAIPLIVPASAECIPLSIATLGEDFIRLRLGAPMRSLPGQFALVRLPAEMDDKPLGILNVPGHPQVWEFLIPLGDGTKAAFAQADTLPSIAVDGPYGTAYYRSGTRFPVCVADSEGLAQASRIARAAMSDPDCELLTVLIAGASVDDPVCGVLFDGLHDSELPIDFHSLVFAGDTTEAQRARQLGEALRANIQSSAERSISEMAFYLFGSARMVAGCRRVLSQEPGIPTANVHFDAYY